MTENTSGTSVRTLGALLICTLFCGPLFAQAPPSADTFVSSGTPKINYGQRITLNVASGVTSYVQFNLAGVPLGATIGGAMLRLFVDGVVTGGDAAGFWSKPLTSATITAPFVLNSSEQAQLYQLGGTSAQVGASPVAFRVVDCAGTPLGDAVLTINPVPVGIGGPFTAQSLGFNLGAPNFWALNEPVGSVRLVATDHGITFGQTRFTITGGQTVYVTITP